MTARNLPRGDKGRFTTDPAVAARDAEIADRIVNGETARSIANDLGMALSSVYEARDRALNALRRPPTEQLMTLEVERLEKSLERYREMEALVTQTLTRQHITVSQGKAVYDDSGEAVWDDEFVLKAVDRLAKIENQRTQVAARLAHLLGINQPAKTEISGTLTYEIIGLDLGE
jgi:hypothetical protein